MSKVNIGKYVLCQIFSFTDLIAQSSSEVFSCIFFKKNFQSYIFLSLYMTEVQHVQYLSFYIFHSKIYLHQNPNVIPDKPLPISCNQIYAVPIVSHEIYGH